MPCEFGKDLVGVHDGSMVGQLIATRAHRRFILLQSAITGMKKWKSWERRGMGNLKERYGLSENDGHKGHSNGWIREERSRPKNQYLFAR